MTSPEHHPLTAELLSETGRLLLENGESAAEIDRALTMAAASLGAGPCRVVISYERVAVSLAQQPPVIARVSEVRFNAALQARVHSELAKLRRHEITVDETLAHLARLESRPPRQAPWVIAAMLAAAAACLARLLGADQGAMLSSAVAVGLGFLVRHELGRRHVSILALPFAAALIGALLGGVAIRYGWTSTPGLALMVPSLILVPGPHILTGILDLIDNYVPLSVARLALAAGVLIAAALGVAVGIEVVLGEAPDAQVASGPALGLLADMLLAGVVTCGFSLAYHTEWSRVGLAVLGGMLGHGLRYYALQSGCPLGAATFLGGLAVGIAAALIARSTKSPFAVIAFAGAVTMMPGVQIYRSLGGVLRLARLSDAAVPPAAAELLSNAAQAAVIAGALALGLIVGQRAIALLEPSSSKRSGSKTN